MNYRSAIFSEYLSDRDMEALVSDEALIAGILRFESALATAQGKLGIIPKASAAAIASHVEKLKIAPTKLAESTQENGVPLLALLAEATKGLSERDAEHLHHGATSQDAMDTALMLMLKKAAALLRSRTQEVIQLIDKLNRTYGDTPCMARTRGQLARPIVLRIRLEAWSHPLRRQLERLDVLEKKSLAVQLGGAVGDRQIFDGKGDKLANAIADELGLADATAWHAQRDRIAAFTSWLAITTGVLSKMGGDILIMSQNEVGEVQESPAGGKSTAMAHKRNPVLSEVLVAIHKINANLQSTVLLGMTHFGERDATGWIVEWNAVPQMLIWTSTALKHAATIASGMKVNVARMKANVGTFMGSNG